MSLRRPKRNKWEIRALAKLRKQQLAAKAPLTQQGRSPSYKPQPTSLH